MGLVMKQRRMLVLSLLFLSFCTTPSVGQINRDLPDLVASSADIVRARVIGLSAQWSTDQHGKHIYTTAQLELFATYKGMPSTFLTYIGGTVDTITESVSDMFVLQLQDEAFFFIPENIDKFNASAISLLIVKNGAVKKDQASIKVGDIESAINAMVKNSTVNIKFIDLYGDKTNQKITAPLQNKSPGLYKTATAPNLVPYAIWNSSTYPIIVRNTPATVPYVASETDSSPLNDNDSTLVSLCIANMGTDPAGAFSVNVYIDTQLFWIAKYSGVSGGFLSYTSNNYIGSISQGTHTLKMVVDPDNQIIESNETDNEYSRSISVNHVAGVPYISSISPASVPAGTGLLVTIAGSGFGATQSTSVVEFFYQVGHSKIYGAVNSWSDTEIKCSVPVGMVDGYAGAAGSGPVIVRTSVSASGGYPITVTYAYSGVQWSTNTPTYKINENYSPIIGEGAAVQAAMTTWSNGGSAFSFMYGGATSITSASRDFTNAILWGATGGSLATNYYWSSGGVVLESDIVFDSTFSWRVGSNYDIQSIATHELGHSLSLRDQYGNGDIPEIMYGFGGSGEIKRVLTSAETAGIQWVYGIVPVELISFLATTNATSTTLAWTTVTEINNYGFEIERREITPALRPQAGWQKIGFVRGNGTSNSTYQYSFTDTTVTTGRYAYRLKQVDNNGKYKYSNEVEVAIAVPLTYSLNQNYPNPFNPKTTIRFQLPEDSNVDLKIYDLVGREIAVLMHEQKPAGFYALEWNAEGMSSGVYFYKLTAGTYTQTKKLVLLK